MFGIRIVALFILASILISYSSAW